MVDLYYCCCLTPLYCKNGAFRDLNIILLAVQLFIAFINAVFKKKKTLFTSRLDLNLRKKLVECYIWSIALYVGRSSSKVS